MKRFFRHFAFAAFGVSILCLALGIAMLIWTATAMKWISYGFGAVMILSGILQIASYLTGERVGLLRKLLLISGIIAAVAGVWILLTQSLAEQVMRLTVIVMGVVLLYHGFMDCKHGLDIKSCETGGLVGGACAGRVHLCGGRAAACEFPLKRTIRFCLPRRSASCWTAFPASSPPLRWRTENRAPSSSRDRRP